MEPVDALGIETEEDAQSASFRTENRSRKRRRLNGAWLLVILIPLIVALLGALGMLVRYFVLGGAA